MMQQPALKRIVQQPPEFSAGEAASQYSTAGETLKILLSIIAVIGALALTLRLLKPVPGWIQAPETEIYPGIQQTEAALGIEIALPSYFPQILAWPPSQIKVIRKSSVTIEMLFLSQKNKTPGLIVRQIIPPATENDAGLTSLLPAQESRYSHVRIAPYTGTLVSGKDTAGVSYAHLSWRTNDRLIVLAGRLSPEDLLRMARSIH